MLRLRDARLPSDSGHKQSADTPTWFAPITPGPSGLLRAPTRFSYARAAVMMAME